MIETKDVSPGVPEIGGGNIISMGFGQEARERLIRGPVKIVIFDLDGTLIDNGPKFVNIFVRQMEADFDVKRGYAWIYATEEENKHKRSSQLVRGCLDYLGVPANEKAIVHTIREVSQKRSKATGPPFPQTEQTLIRLTREGSILAVCTRSDYEDAMFKLKFARLDHHFIQRTARTGERVYSVVGKDSGPAGVDLKKGKPQFEVLAGIMTGEGEKIITCDDIEAEGLFVSDSPEDFKDIGHRIRKAGLTDDPLDRIALIKAGANPVLSTSEFEHLPSYVKYI